MHSHEESPIGPTTQDLRVSRRRPPVRWTCRAVARDNVHTPDDHQPGFAYRFGMSMLFFAALSGLGLVAWKFVVHGPWWVFAGAVLFILWWFEGPGK
jgi:hypothetical protein